MEKLKEYNTTSLVEAVALRDSVHESIYSPREKIRCIEMDNFPLLGKLTALRFIEWVQNNPGGIISLPTGKTPEFFIKWVQRILHKWNSKEIQSILEYYQMDGTKSPDMQSLSFVQIDEFYPMNAQQENSFHSYVSKFYINGFGLDPAKALLIDSTTLGLAPGKRMEEVFPQNIVDLSLRVRHTKTELEREQKDTINRVDWFCMEYERTIREKGGIGFFLGGLGPDGHIAFNVRGSSFYSVTRLTGTNYETQAAAAADLGGIENSRNRLVITIGLSTISYNPSVVAIISVAGAAKAELVRLAVEEEKHPQYPSTILHDLPHARLFLTKGAAEKLSARKFQNLCKLSKIDDEQCDEAVITLALKDDKNIDDLTAEDFLSDRMAQEVIKKSGLQPTILMSQTHQRLLQKIEKGLQSISNTTFLHTEPHHDDIMLGYLPYFYHLVRDPSNQHYFANLTSGFTSVTNRFCISMLQDLLQQMETVEFHLLYTQQYFDPKNTGGRMEDVYLFLEGSAADIVELQSEARSHRLLRNFIEIYRSTDIKYLSLRIRELEEYLRVQYPGAKDPPDIQLLKGMIREFEVELLWAYFGIESTSIYPLRLGFYQGDIFSEEPQVNRDVLPVFELMKKLRPQVVTVAFDPEGSGPDTHYKALQAVAEALRMCKEGGILSDVKIWGYRNVWFRFHPWEANIIVPVSLNTLSLTHTAFMNCFGSQRSASFPSYEHDGPFSELAQKIQVDQYSLLKKCLGKEYFYHHAHPRMRAARGLMFLKEMSFEEFYSHVRELRKVTEARD